VVCAGDTLADPVSGRIPEDTVGEIEKDAAFVTFQLSVVLCPCVIVLEPDANAITACEGPLPPGAVTAPPPQPIRKTDIKTKEIFKTSCRTTDEALERVIEHSHPGVMAEM
jgi:hypothetical protein